MTENENKVSADAEAVGIQIDLLEGDVEEVLDDGRSDLQRLMSKKAEELTQIDIANIVKRLRERRNLYALEELEKARKPVKEPKEKAPAKPRATKPKTEQQQAAAEIANMLTLDDLGDLGL